MSLLRRKSRGSVTEFLQEQEDIHSANGWGLAALDEHHLHRDTHRGAEQFSEAGLHVQEGQKQSLFNYSRLLFRMCALKYTGSNFKVQKKRKAAIRRERKQKEGKNIEQAVYFSQFS